MNNSTPYFRRPLASVRTAIVVVFLVVALIGFADATFLTVEHYRGVIPPCTTAGCDTVLTSSYSVILGVPVSLLGAIYYLIMAAGAFMYLEARHGSGTIASHHSAILKWSMAATVLGLVMSVYFVSVMSFALHAWCQYCLGSAATSTLLFLIAWPTLHKHLREPLNAETL